LIRAGSFLSLPSFKYPAGSAIFICSPSKTFKIHAFTSFRTLPSSISRTHTSNPSPTLPPSQPLDSTLQKRLEAALKASQIAASRGGKTIKIESKVNPSIQGGLKIDFGDKTVDLSVSSRVGQLNALLKRE